MHRKRFNYVQEMCEKDNYQPKFKFPFLWFRVAFRRGYLAMNYIFSSHLQVKPCDSFFSNGIKEKHKFVTTRLRWHGVSGLLDGHRRL